MSERMSTKIGRLKDEVYAWEAYAAKGLVCALVEAAAKYYTEADDFCIQHVGELSVTFGGTNRLQWTPAWGFRADGLSCTPEFMNRYKELGPHPGL